MAIELRGMEDKTMGETRVPKVGDKIIFQGNRGEWIEGEVLAAATDKDGKIGRVKVAYRGAFGLQRESWIWPFDLCYLNEG
jgi:hypothetical protein